MTIFEMLEKLETEIVSLQTRYQDLANSVQHVHTNGSGGRAETPKRARKRPGNKAAKSASKKRTPKKRTPPPAAQEFAQLELPVNELAPSAESHPGRVLGKRQALGKSLVQLRKMSSWRNPRNAEE